MPAKAQTVLTALLLAYSALGAPINNDQQIELQSVIDALKVQVEDLDLPYPSSIIDDVESALKAKGVLDAKTLAALNKKIDVSGSSRWLQNHITHVHTSFGLRKRTLLTEIDLGSDGT